MMETKKAEQKLHSGKWTPEEEAYVEGLMEEFRAGTLDLQEGTTLRSFLATKLNCKPKRISKKYEGKNYDGKQLYWNSEEDISPQELRARRAKLDRLELKFKECLKAIDIAKASRQNPKQESENLTALHSAAPRQHQAEKALGSNSDLFLSRAAVQLGTNSSIQTSPSLASSLPAFFPRVGPSQADAALLLARHHRQQALELELQAASASSNPTPFLGGLARRSFLSASEAALMMRPTSPLLNLRPPSPRSNSLLAEAAAFEHARLAMAARGIRPSLNQMLSSPSSTGVARRTSGNQLAGGVFDESLMRLQQQPMMRDLGAGSNHNSNDLWLSQLCAQQQLGNEERKRQAMIEDELSQRKRQRFL